MSQDLQSRPAPTPSGNADPKDHTVGAVDPLRQRIWDHVSSSPIHSLWDFQGVPPMLVAKRSFNAFNNDNLLSRAAELGYYFLFALFPTLVTASAILGLAARSATDIYMKLIAYMSVVVPPDALKIVLDTFNQTTAHSSGGKITFGIAAALWSASVGFSAIQDTLNTVYKVRETRAYWKVKGTAILVTVLLTLIITSILASLLFGTFFSHFLRHHMVQPQLSLAVGIIVHLTMDVVAISLLILLFAVIYYFAPDVQNKHWRWFTPGALIGIVGWIAASLALRLYLHFSNTYSVTYGSLGAVIILLTWFYITGLMLLIGAEINSEIEAAAAEALLKREGVIPAHATTDPEVPIPVTAAAA